MKAARLPISPQWAWHQRTLTRLRAALVREHGERSAAACAPHETAADVVDIANGECEHEKLLAELGHEQDELVAIDAALERLRNGAYGLCEATGKPIEPERLRAIPWTRFCSAAARQREQSVSTSTRT